MKRVLLLSVLCSLGSWFAPASHAGPLRYSIGAGSVGGGDQSTGLVSFGLSKLAFPHLEVTIDVAYMRFAEGSFGNRCTGGPCPSSDLESSFIPVSLGLIGYLRGPKQSGPYGEFSPSLYVNKWSMEGAAGSGEFTALTAGLKVGLGVRLAISENGQFDLGVLYLLSGSGDIDDDSIRAFTGVERFEGLEKAVPIARLSLSL